MKKQLVKTTALLCCVFLMCACEKSDVEPEFLNNDAEQFTFIYNDTIYSSSYEELEEGEIVLLDEKVDIVRKNLLKFPELITVYNYDGIVEYFENENIATKRLNEGTLFKENVFTRANNIKRYYVKDSRLIVYEEKNYKGDSRTYSHDVSIPELWRPPMKIYTISSFKLSSNFHHVPIGKYPLKLYTNVFARFYTGSNFTGKQSWWRLDYNLQNQNISSLPKDIRGKVNSLKVDWL